MVPEMKMMTKEESREYRIKMMDHDAKVVELARAIGVSHPLVSSILHCRKPLNTAYLDKWHAFFQSLDAKKEQQQGQQQRQLEQEPKE